MLTDTVQLIMIKISTQKAKEQYMYINIGVNIGVNIGDNKIRLW